MKKKAFTTFFILILIYLNVQAQNDSDQYPKIFTKAEKEAEFPGGNSSWLLYLVKNLRMKVAEDFFRKEKIERQTVNLEFIVDTGGKVSQVKVINLKEVYPKVAKETIRAVRKGPDWIPAEQNGKKVVFLKKLSVTWSAPQD